MKNLLFITILLLLVNCTSSINKNNSVITDENCVENIEIVHNYVKLHKGESKNVYAALKFIAKYSNVSFEDMANYARTYPLGIYEKDYPTWVDWYEQNKCNNIQFKK